MDASNLLNVLDAALTGGRSPDDMKTVILKAVDAASTPEAKVQAALYLIATSSEYQVER
jgi:hypothetical protein